MSLLESQLESQILTTREMAALEGAMFAAGMPVAGIDGKSSPKNYATFSKIISSAALSSDRHIGGGGA